mgnify:CR=1 FL=1|jgi:hypothetical protein
MLLKKKTNDKQTNFNETCQSSWKEPGNWNLEELLLPREL